MDSSKGIRPTGTDGADFKSRHVVENRFQAAALARAKLQAMLRTYLIAIVGNTFFFLGKPYILAKENTLETMPFGWATVTFFAVIWFLGHRSLSKKNDSLIKVFQGLSLVGCAAVGYFLYLELVRPPTSMAPPCVLAVTVGVILAAVRTAGQVLANSVQMAKKSS
eukprot:comp21179_c0_seq1/m.28717 comp21179_c0_seq1/g.28717  ORF comp21179_c0_seq1/g.28717 comp21179_c0_seq1/m.28717 type:complete len:165 (-) comp21179_c0_seq1:168-662(-)